jgi:secreted PhoX family phosphatase
MPALPLPLLLLACTAGRERLPAVPELPAPPAPAPTGFAFVPAPHRDTAGGTGVSAALRVAGADTPLGWHPVAVEGVAYGDHPPFGTLVDQAGAPLPTSGGAHTCHNPDYNGIFEAHGATWMLTHQECTPAAMYLSKLQRDPAGGFTTLWSRPIAAPADGPFHQLCSGQVTDWGTVLSGEEYETDVAQLEAGFPAHPPGKVGDAPFEDYSGYASFSRFFGEGAAPSPYGVGWMVETRVDDAEGATTAEKRLSLGRFSHELALMMPDRRTVYLTDDYRHALFGMFIADTPGDLTAGRLYAARWDWVAEDGDLLGDAPALTWVDLGHADERDLRAALQAGLSFDQMFDRQPKAGDCPDGFTPVRAPQSVDECLRVKPGQDALASRFETRRMAGLLGATVELSKAEGLALDPDGRHLYLALTRFEAGTSAGDPPWAGADHVQVGRNRCGAVVRFDLTGDEAIGSTWVAGAGSVVVAGVPDGEGGCALPPGPGAHTGISEPDNLTFVPGAGTLLIAEDTDRSPNRLWAWTQEGGLVEVFHAPPQPPEGRMAEVSGLSFVPDVGGAGWITLSLQHPGPQPAVVGVLGPLPAGD